MTTSDTGQAQRNAVLERLLARAGWTPENLGDRLNELATTLNLRTRIHRRTPPPVVYAEAERTAPRIPRDPWPSLICHLLHERVGETVTLDPRGAVAALASVADADFIERRHFVAVTGLSLTAVAHQWLFDPARVAASVLGKRIDHAL